MLKRVPSYAAKYEKIIIYGLHGTYDSHIITYRTSKQNVRTRTHVYMYINISFITKKRK